MRRVSSRHDDECRNVRLEARNSMVCSSVLARVSYIRLECRTPGLPESTGVYEISRSTPFSRCFRGDAFASTLDLFALHFARFSSRKSTSAPPTRRDGSRRATRYPAFLRRGARRGGENLHAFRRESEARGGGNSGQNPLLSRERCCFAATSVNASLSAPFAYIYLTTCVIKFYLAHLSKVNVKGAKGTVIRKIFALISAPLLFTFLRVHSS